MTHRGNGLRVAIMTDEIGWHTRQLQRALRERGGVGRCIDLADCDIDTSVRSDALCQLAAIALKQPNRKLNWDPVAEQFTNDDAANALMKARAFRGDWKLPAV